MSNTTGKAIAAKARDAELQLRLQRPRVFVLAMVHSEKKRGPQQVEYLEQTGANTHRVKTPAGVICTAIYNPFSGLYYADDIYAAEPGGG